MIFNSIDQATTRTSGSSVPVPSSSRTLRDRTKLGSTQNERSVSEPERKAPRRSTGGTSAAARKPRSSIDPSPAMQKPKPKPKSKPRSSVEPVVTSQPEDSSTESSSLSELSEPEQSEPLTLKQDGKQVPRVVLKLGKRPEEVEK